MGKRYCGKKQTQYRGESIVKGKQGIMATTVLASFLLILFSGMVMAAENSTTSPSAGGLAETTGRIVCNVSGGEGPLDIRLAFLSTEPIASYHWSVSGAEDFFSSSEKNPVFHLENAGLYDVEFVTDDKSEPVKALIVVSDDGQPPIKVPVKSDFLVEMSGLQVKLTEFSEGASSWNWDFGDGCTCSSSKPERDPAHVYEKPGTYLVSLEAIGPDGDRDVRIEKIVVTDNKKVTTDFTSKTLSKKAPFKVAFTGKSDAKDLRWNFGDGGTSSAKDPVHVYKKAGNYRVSLTASNQAVKAISLKQK